MIFMMIWPPGGHIIIKIMFICLIDWTFWLPFFLVAAYVVFRMSVGHRRFRRHFGILEKEGLLRQENFVLILVRFPMIRRLTLARIYLSRGRFILFHFLTRGMILQTPLGPQGSAGKEEGYFEVEGNYLVFKTRMRGGGRFRFKVKNPEAWLRDIREN